MERVKAVLRRILYSLCITDWFLLAFLAVLMIQAAHNLFANDLARQDTSTVDTMIRTTAAAIFGYFIGGSFLRGSRPDPQARENIGTANEPARQDALAQPGAPTARIGFAGVQQAPERTAAPPPPAPDPPRKTLSRREHQQIYIVGTVGFTALLLLVITRNFVPAGSAPAAAATLSQLRDFVCGSVGLLIGHSAQSSKASS